MNFEIKTTFANKSIAWKLAVLSCFSAAILVGVVCYTVITLKTQESDATGINIAGRQRMLTQKYTKEIFDELNGRQTILATERQTAAIATQIMEDRAYYTENIVGKLKKEQIKITVTADFHNKKGAIPAPATFVQGVSAELDNKQASYSYQLLSKYNINPDKGLSNPISQQAWNALERDPAKPFIKVDQTESGGAMLHYAQADIALKGCVSCHNSHPASPKLDFVEGDLMGILTVQAAITDDPMLAANLINPSRARPADKTAELFEISLKALKEGGVTYSDLAMKNEIELPSAPNRAIADKLSEVEALWSEMMASVDFLRTANDTNTKEYIEHLDKIRSLNITTLKTMNNAVGQFASASSGNITQLIWGITIVLFASLAIVAWVSYTITQMIALPLKEGIEVAKRISNGDLTSSINIRHKDETGQLLQTMEQMQQKLTQVIENEVQTIVDTAKEGNLTKRIALDNKAGFYQKLSSSINELVDVSESVVSDTVRMFGAMARGDLGQRIETDYQGAFDELKKDANQTVEKLTQVINGDIHNLVNAARNGDLSQRIDLNGKDGFFNSLSAGINSLVAVNEQVVDDTVSMFSAMARGDLGQRIEPDYQGAFNKLKQDANQTVEKLTQVIEGDIQSLVNAARGGDLTQRINLDDKQGFFSSLSGGINDLVAVNEQVVNDTVRMFAAMAEGDLSQQIDAQYQGAFNELKQDANQTVEKLTNVIGGDIQTLVNAAKEGDLSQRIDLSGKTGFFRTLSQGVNELVDVNERIIEDTVRVVSAMASGNLTSSIGADYKGIFGKLKDDINSTQSKLVSIISDIRATAHLVSTGSIEIATGNQDLSMRTEAQASTLEETAASMEEMASSVKESAANASNSADLALEAKNIAEQGGGMVDLAITAMNTISRSSKEIGDIIGVIDEIAFQTNLLALNAAVEAARAGEHGRGFAVVAGEVRNLAQRSASAAKEIKGLINDSGSKVSEGTGLVNKTGEILTGIVQSIGNVTLSVNEIRDAAQEQNSGIQQVNTAVTQMDEMTQQNAALVEEAAAAGESMSDQAKQMMKLMDFFQLNSAEVGSSSNT